MLEVLAVLIFGWAMLYAHRKRLHLRAMSHLRPWEMHHLYLGIGLYLLGLWLGWVISAIGVWITWDDAYQHAFQAFQHRVRFRSFLHRVYEKVFVWYAEHFW